MQIAALFISTLLFSAGVLWFDADMARSFFKRVQASHYPSVAGRVTHSEVKSSGGLHGVDEAVIHYRFEVGGKVFNGTRLRYNSGDSGAAAAAAGGLVASHPVGATVPVYYNPSDPADSLLFAAITGLDFLMFLSLAPFNAIMLGIWLGISTWLRERIFRPVAGGVKIIVGDMVTRARLPRFPAMGWALITVGGLGFIGMFVVGFGTMMNPSIGFVLSAIAVVYLTGLAVYVYQQRKINSGIDDIVIHQAERTIDLPQTFGRKQHVTVSFADIEFLRVQKKVHSGRKGTSYTYAPTLTLRGTEPPEQLLADWQDKLRADDFTDWLRQQLGLPAPPNSKT